MSLPEIQFLISETSAFFNVGKLSFHLIPQKAGIVECKQNSVLDSK